MTRYTPIMLAVLLIAGLTYVQVRMTDRFADTNVSAEQRAALLDKVPKTVGDDWHGEDMPIDPNVRKTAGAVGAVQREYRNSRTGEKVRLWLIVGHAREVSAHTPDICYPGQGFQARASENSVYPMEVPGLPKADFLTNTFLRESSAGQQLERVFWSWYNPENSDNEGNIVWEAPRNARWHFGNTRALYKLYVSGSMRDPKEGVEQSACVRFAREFLPEVNEALAEVQLGETSGEATGTSAGEAVAADLKAEVEKTAETASSEPATSEKSPPSAAEKELFETDSTSKAEPQPNP
jgi:hypothetical protein